MRRSSRSSKPRATGVTAWVKQGNALVPVVDAPLDGAVFRSGVQAEHDFTSAAAHVLVDGNIDLVRETAEHPRSSS